MPTQGRHKEMNAFRFYESFMREFSDCHHTVPSLYRQAAQQLGNQSFQSFDLQILVTH